MAPKLFGKGWQNSDWADDPQNVFRSSQINLGIGYALASAKIANAKGRDIECPAVGACYLTTYHWELAEMFEIGKEVLCYRNLEELVEMLIYYRKRPDACLKIAQAAHRRAHSEHTWEYRLRGLFREIGFDV
jgi:spore maturation protein CgeB